MLLSYNLFSKVLGGSAIVELNDLLKNLVILGFEVEDVCDYEKKYKNVVIGNIENTEQHPNADKLQICTVNIGDKGKLQIVCGAKNARIGINVAVSLSGATLPNGTNIEISKIRGVKSVGMICSAQELCLEKEKVDGIMELDIDFEIGQTFAHEYFNSDIVIDVAITPNRGDCNSVIGLTREICAFLDLGENNVINRFWKNVNNLETEFKEKVNLQMNPTTEISGKLYCGKIVNISGKTQSSKYIRQTLRALGLKTHNSIIDVSNYVTAITGIPVHMYDADKVSGNIVLTKPSKKEEFICIDQSVEILGTNTPVVKDCQKTICIFGVMGSGNSSVSKGTKSVIIECGYVRPSVVMVGNYGIHVKSEARYRSERGVDHGNISKNLTIAIKTLLEETGGELISIGGVDSAEDKDVIINYPISDFKRITGVLINEDKAVKFIKGLGINILKRQQTQEGDVILKLSIPTHRHDISIKEDITEDLVRLYDINNIPTEPIFIQKLPRGTNNFEDNCKIIKLLSGRGYHEVINYMFIEKELATAFYNDVNTELELISPMIHLNTVQQSCIPNLIKNLKYNISHHAPKSISLCEMTTVFKSCTSGQQVVGGVRYGNRQIISCNEPSEPFTVFDIKNDLVFILGHNRYTQTQIDAGTSNDKLPLYCHPYRSYKIEVNGCLLARFGQIHPNILLQHFDIKEDILFFEVYSDNLSVQTDEIANKTINISHPKEMCFIIDKSITCGQVIKAISGKCTELNHVAIKDLFINDNEFGEEKKSINISFSLVDKNIDAQEAASMMLSAFQKVLSVMKELFNGELRGSVPSI
ncbi:MAG: phenylalanine--tRNA ligase subunit beta [Alphaproteobacteria bacterium]|nr:phenylalanine--tRNA ligase subunit beta [Rickettsiales bacterium]